MVFSSQTFACSSLPPVGWPIHESIVFVQIAKSTHTGSPDPLVLGKSPGAGLNRRPRPYQGRALPTELPGHFSRKPHAKWSGKRDSNPRPRAWKARALPTELFPQKMVEREGFEPSKASPADLQSAPFGHSGTSPLRLGLQGPWNLPFIGIKTRLALTPATTHLFVPGAGDRT